MSRSRILSSGLVVVALGLGACGGQAPVANGTNPSPGSSAVVASPSPVESPRSLTADAIITKADRVTADLASYSRTIKDLSGKVLKTEKSPRGGPRAGLQLCIDPASCPTPTYSVGSQTCGASTCWVINTTSSYINNDPIAVVYWIRQDTYYYERISLRDPSDPSHVDAYFSDFGAG